MIREIYEKYCQHIQYASPFNVNILREALQKSYKAITLNGGIIDRIVSNKPLDIDFDSKDVKEPFTFSL